MTHYDVFNGDADGICALQQLRLAKPMQSTLVTGVKRDIQLLQKVSGTALDTVTVLDISLDKNRSDLNRLIEQKTTVEYFDHHYAGDIPSHPNFTSHIDTAADTCTSLIVNTHLSNAHVLWAIVGAFGDNFDDKAFELAKKSALTSIDAKKLKNLGIALNYNGYGETENDLHYKPAYLAQIIRSFDSPLDFINNSEIASHLTIGYKEDIAKAKQILPIFETDQVALYILPNESWARRASGVYGNLLCRSHQIRAHAILTKKKDNSYLVSVRAPNLSASGADELCRQFQSGGGRKAAAGINNLPMSEYENFTRKFKLQFS